MIDTVLIQSALLGGIEAGLLVFFKDETNFGATDASCRCNGPEWNQTTMQKSILTLTYLSLVLSLGVTVTSYALTAEFSAIPVRAAKDPLLANNPANIIQGSNWDILRHYCLKGHTRFVYIYCRNSIYLDTSSTLMDTRVCLSHTISSICGPIYSPLRWKSRGCGNQKGRPGVCWSLHCAGDVHGWCV